MSPRRRGVTARLLALWALPALLLAGCVSVPFSGGIEAGGPLEAGLGADVDFLPSGPSDDASQEEILQGFLAATTASQNNYRIARSYLAEEVAETWNPYASTLVRSREGLVEREDDATLTYSVPISASVDSVGRYSESESSTPQTLPEFGFVQEEGQWRIAELGDGILISQQAFPSAFSPHSCYYYGPRVDSAIWFPDLRWFPATCLKCDPHHRSTPDRERPECCRRRQSGSCGGVRAGPAPVRRS